MWRCHRSRILGPESKATTYDVTVASRDPAFLWETEVLRSRDHVFGSSRRGDEDAGEWMTVKEASDSTGIPTSTIRKWARNENIPSFLERTGDVQMRRVSMSGIRQRADELGRDIEPSKKSTRGETSSDAESRDTITTPQAVRETTGTSVPDGTMLVPLDAWNRMLNQLGNLHEAGQQLAEARERAAKAETESRFLKERLAELRDELNRAEPAAPAPRPDHPDVGTDRNQPLATSIVRSIYRSWRVRRRQGD